MYRDEPEISSSFVQNSRRSRDALATERKVNSRIAFVIESPPSPFRRAGGEGTGAGGVAVVAAQSCFRRDELGGDSGKSSIGSSYDAV